MDYSSYSVVQAQALHALDEILNESRRTGTGRRARLLERLRTAVGMRLIQVGHALEGQRTPPYKQESA